MEDHERSAEDPPVSGVLAPVRTTLDGLVGDGRERVLAILALGWLATLGLRFLLPVLLPALKADFEISNTTAGLAISVVWLTYAAMQFPAGILIDWVGERLLLLVSVLIGGVGVVLLSVAPLFSLFLLAGAVFGFGHGLYGPPRGTILSKIYPENDGAAFGVVIGAGSIGAAAIPVLGSLLVGPLGWRRTIGVFVPVFVVVAAGLWRWLPADRPSRDRAADSVVGSVRRDFRAVRDNLLRGPILRAAGAVMLMLFGFQGLTAFLPTYLADVKAIDPQTAAGLYALLFLSGALCSLGAGGAADRLGHRRVLAMTAGVSVVPLAALPYVAGVIPLAIVSLLLGIRLSVVPVAHAYIIRVIADEVTGTAWGLLRTTFFAIGSAGSVFVGGFADSGLFSEAFLGLAILTAVAAVLYGTLPRREQVV